MLNYQRVLINLADKIYPPHVVFLNGSLKESNRFSVFKASPRVPQRIPPPQ
jgi:hypothetical protein